MVQETSMSSSLGRLSRNSLKTYTRGPEQQLDVIPRKRQDDCPIKPKHPINSISKTKVGYQIMEKQGKTRKRCPGISQPKFEDGTLHKTKLNCGRKGIQTYISIQGTGTLWSTNLDSGACGIYKLLLVVNKNII